MIFTYLLQMLKLINITSKDYMNVAQRQSVYMLKIMSKIQKLDEWNVKLDFMQKFSTHLCLNVFPWVLEQGLC